MYPERLRDNTVNAFTGHGAVPPVIVRALTGQGEVPPLTMTNGAVPHVIVTNI